MKVVFGDINNVFDTESEGINTLIVENQKFMVALLEDISRQIEGCEGKTIISKDNKIMELSKYCELLVKLVPFDLNTKTLNTKATTSFEKQMVSSDFYEQTMELLGNIERYLDTISFSLPGNIIFNKISAGYLVKAMGLSFENEYDNLGEKLLDYFELVSEYDRRKLFVIVNLRSYMSDTETIEFFKSIVMHKYDVIIIESQERNLLANEIRYIVDSDLCEIS